MRLSLYSLVAYDTTYCMSLQDRKTKKGSLVMLLVEEEYENHIPAESVIVEATRIIEDKDLGNFWGSWAPA